MIHRFSRITVSLLICLSISVTATAQIVDIPDPNLRVKIEAALGKAAGDTITAAELAKLTDLNAWQANISDLTGLEAATNLTSLNLGANNISDISAVSGLTNLTQLFLYTNNISDISPVAGLINLTQLYLYDNSISDISPVAGLINLTELVIYDYSMSDLADNNISDISPVAGLINLTELNLRGNNISDLSPVASLTNLTELFLSDNSILDLSHISSLGNLTRLDLWGNSISDISPVAGLTNLTQLHLYDNSILDLSALVGLTNLIALSLSNNSISDLSPLVANTGLGSGSTVYVEGNPLSYASIHTHLPTLQSRGVTVHFTDQAHPALLKASGDNQIGAAAAALANPFVVGVQDENGAALAGVAVTFTVTGGGGTLSATNITTDANGRAASTLTLGPNLGTNTVSVAADGIESQVIFNALADGVADVNVDIPDPNLRAAIEEALGKAAGDTITAAEMTTLTTLVAINADIRDLTGLEAATNLTDLDLSGNWRVSDISLLTDLVNLTHLRFGAGVISDISAISGLTNLTELILFGNRIADISPVAGLTNLTELDLSGNRRISDISPISGLTNLTKLRLSGRYSWMEATTSSKNDISDISAVSGLTNLTELNLSSSSISDISPVSGLTHLTSLNLYDNSISDISPVSGLSNLTTLNFGGNDISDISAVSGHLTNLINLDLGGNSLSDILAVSGLTHLTSLNLYDNSISDISAVSGLTNLIELYLDFNNISDPSPVAGLTNLTKLALWGNNISDLSPLVANTGLESGDEVFMHGNPLSYVSVHTHIPTLRGRGVTVYFTDQAHPALLKVSGDDQTGTTGAALASPFVVEVQDENGAALAGVSVTFAVTAGGGTLSATNTITDANGRVESILTLGADAGPNTVAVAAEGIESQVTFYANAETESPTITADANGDGVVNLLDLVLVGANFGQTGQNAADVNGDGVVNINDLILIAGAISSIPAAPAIQPQTLDMFNAADVKLWLFEAQQMDLTDVKSLRGILFLEQLLAALIPTATELLPNYPNPFNPETWIPYRLAADAFVTLTIYDTTGQVIRTLEVGHRLAAAYETRSKAIYWDGRNQLGEQVASGVYFYALTAGDYSATRRMVILK